VRLLGLAQDDPLVPTTGPGSSAKFLFDALARRYELVGRAGVDLTRSQRYLLAATSFHPSKDKWRARMYWRPRALNLRSFNSRGALKSVDQPFDLVVQVFGLFRTTGARYVLYLDNTIDVSRREWPEWVAVEGWSLERLYAWERRLFNGAAHLFTMGGPAARSLTNFYGVPQDKVTVVGGGACLDELPEPTSSAREPAILFVGSDWRRKGGDVLVEAFRRVRAKHPDARLQIVGTTEPEPEPGVEVRGFLTDRDELAQLYARASVFCLPSRFEPYGLAAIEAMAHEVPCVVTPGALAEVVQHGETGLVVIPGDVRALSDALNRLLDDPPYARWFGVNGRSRVEQELTWDAVVERMAPDLERVASVGSGRLDQRRPRRSSRFRRRARQPADC
jgi:glycosyltransferase involved in cell wall biosynthesis